MLIVGINNHFFELLYMEKEREYKRDKRSPVPSSSTVSKIMSSVKSKNTKPEILFRRYLYQNGIRGYRLNYKKLQGKPDVVFIRKRVAIFINGCFWHRCPNCNFPMPKSNTTFWKDKFEKNIQRDKIKNEILQELGWKVVTIWECEINNMLDEAATSIINLLKKNGNKSS
jgi:DNA mismatch endonuclease, patch repair protein